MASPNSSEKAGQSVEKKENAYLDKQLIDSIQSEISSFKSNHIETREKTDDDDEEKHEAQLPKTTPESSSTSTQRPFKYENIDIRDVTCDLRPLRIYLDGVFDVTHFGHYRLFKHVKDKFPRSTIIAGVTSDEDTVRYKGQTVLNAEERAESIGHCKWVDEVICPCVWVITDEFLDKHNIDYVAHDGAPYVSQGSDDVYGFVKKQGRFIATQRTDGISTTGLINRIVRRYNEFILRNIHRGVGRKDLNVSWTRLKRIEMTDKLKSNSVLIRENVQAWIDNPSSFVDDFVATYDKVKLKLNSRLDDFRDDFVEYATTVPL